MGTGAPLGMSLYNRRGAVGAVGERSRMRERFSAVSAFTFHLFSSSIPDFQL
jgi:hypothetical protein